MQLSVRSQRFTSRRALVALSLGALTAFSVFAAGCDDDVTAPPAANSSVRVLHASPDAPAVDVFFNSGPQASVSALAFGSGTPFLNVAAGSYRVDVAPAGAGVSSSVLTVPSFALSQNTSYTVVAYNGVSSLQVLPLVDDLSAPPAGQIRVRAVHTAMGVGQVDIWNVPTSGAPSPLYQNVDFGVAGAYLTIPAGAYRLGFDVNNDATPDLSFSIPALPAGTVANVFAMKDTAGSVFLLAQLADGSTVRINAS